MHANTGASPRVGTTIGRSTGLGYSTSVFQIVSSENSVDGVTLNNITNGESLPPIGGLTRLKFAPHSVDNHPGPCRSTLDRSSFEPG